MMMINLNYASKVIDFNQMLTILEFSRIKLI